MRLLTSLKSHLPLLIPFFLNFILAFYTSISNFLIFSLLFSEQPFNDILNNWNQPAILNLTSTLLSTCPQGYAPLSSYTWPGTTTGCICNSTISRGDCSSSQLTSNCSVIPKYQPINLTFWGIDADSDSLMLCYQRASYAFGQITSPINNQSSIECPSNFVLCGNRTNQQAYCIPAEYAGQCAINQIQVVSSRCKKGQPNCLPLDFKGKLSLTWSTVGDGLPLVDFASNEYSMCKNSEQMNITPNRQDYLLLQNRRTDCQTSDDNESWIPWYTLTESSFFERNGLNEIISELPYYYVNGSSDNLYTWNLYYRIYFPWYFRCGHSVNEVLSFVQDIQVVYWVQLGLIVNCSSSFVVWFSYLYSEYKQSLVNPQSQSKCYLATIGLIMELGGLSLLTLTLRTSYMNWSTFGSIASKECSNQQIISVLGDVGNQNKNALINSIISAGVKVLCVVWMLLISLWLRRKRFRVAPSGLLSIQSETLRSDKIETFNNSPLSSPAFRLQSEAEKDLNDEGIAGKGKVENQLVLVTANINTRPSLKGRNSSRGRISLKGKGSLDDAEKEGRLKEGEGTEVWAIRNQEGNQANGEKLTAQEERTGGRRLMTEDEGVRLNSLRELEEEKMKLTSEGENDPNKLQIFSIP